MTEHDLLRCWCAACGAARQERVSVGSVCCGLKSSKNTWVNVGLDKPAMYVEALFARHRALVLALESDGAASTAILFVYFGSKSLLCRARVTDLVRL